MKRKLSLLCVLLLALAMVLAACNQTAATELATRWDSKEEYLFNVSLADFNKDIKYSFNTYPYGDAIYSKDYRIQTNSVLESAVTDEIRPEQVKGTYHVTIQSENDFTELKTEQVIFAQYKLADLEKLAKWNDLKNYKAEDGEIAAMFEETNGMVVLKSTTDAYVKFATGTAQKPMESKTSVNGFYIGEKDQSVSQYVVTAKYDFDAKTVTVNKKVKEGDEDEETTNKLNVTANLNLIDSNQLFLYARSLNKSAKFQDSPSVVVYNAYEDKHYTAGFALTMELNAVLTVNGENKYVKLSATPITLGATAFMLQENLPNLTEKDVDTMTNPSNIKERLAKHTVVRFRVSNLAYELAEYPEGVIEAIEVK